MALIPIAQALAGLFTSPIFILLISGLVLRQHIGPVRILAVAIGFFGIIFVVDTDLADLNFLSFLPIFGGFFTLWLRWLLVNCVKVKALCV